MVGVCEGLSQSHYGLREQLSRSGSTMLDHDGHIVTVQSAVDHARALFRVLELGKSLKRVLQYSFILDCQVDYCIPFS